MPIPKLDDDQWGDDDAPDKEDRHPFDDWGEDGIDSYDDPPLYPEGKLEKLDEAGLQAEWERQCVIHDSAVDRLPMGSPNIENAAARMNIIEAEQKARGFKYGPSDKFGVQPEGE